MSRYIERRVLGDHLRVRWAHDREFVSERLRTGGGAERMGELILEDADYVFEDAFYGCVDGYVYGTVGCVC
jgi:hypothetical protein